MHAQVAQMALDGMVSKVAVAAQELQGVVAGLEPGIGGIAFGHGAVDRGLGRALVQRPRRPVQQQARGLQFGRPVGELELQGLEVGELAAELAAHQHVLAGHLQAGPGTAQGTGADVEPAAIQPHHGDLEALALRAQAISDGHPGILEDHRGGRLAVPAQFLFRLAEAETRRVLGHHQAGDPLGPVPAGAAHDHVEVAGPGA
jgi:hypothetical protein